MYYKIEVCIRSEHVMSNSSLNYNEPKKLIEIAKSIDKIIQETGLYPVAGDFIHPITDEFSPKEVLGRNISPGDKKITYYIA